MIPFKPYCFITKDETQGFANLFLDIMIPPSHRLVDLTTLKNLTQRSNIQNPDTFNPPYINIYVENGLGPNILSFEDTPVATSEYDVDDFFTVQVFDLTDCHNDINMAMLKSKVIIRHKDADTKPI